MKGCPPACGKKPLAQAPTRSAACPMPAGWRTKAVATRPNEAASTMPALTNSPFSSEPPSQATHATTSLFHGQQPIRKVQDQHKDRENQHQAPDAPAPEHRPTPAAAAATYKLGPPRINIVDQAHDHRQPTGATRIAPSRVARKRWPTARQGQQQSGRQCPPRPRRWRNQ